VSAAQKSIRVATVEIAGGIDEIFINWRIARQYRTEFGRGS
jgi:hypothetical protein